MIAIIFGLIFAGLISFLVGKDRLKKDWGWRIISVLCFFLMIGTVNETEAIFFSPVMQKNTVRTISYQKIISLQDQSSVSGNYYLRLNTTEKNKQYVYYIETDQGYTRQTLDADNKYYPVYVKTINGNEQPRIEKYARITQTVLRRKPTVWGSLFIYFSYREYEVGNVICETTSHSTLSTRDDFKSIIYIPSGSVVD